MRLMLFKTRKMGKVDSFFFLVKQHGNFFVIYEVWECYLVINLCIIQIYFCA